MECLVVVANIHSSDPNTLIERIKQKEQEKAAKIEQDKRLQEQKELEKCTFNPKINTEVPRQTEDPIVVRGLDRYECVGKNSTNVFISHSYQYRFLELKDLAKKLENDKREREDKAFKVRNLPPDNPLPFTVPAPFHFQTRDRLAQAKKLQKLEAVNKEMRQREAQELTFKPYTNRTAQNQKIAHILNQS